MEDIGGINAWDDLVAVITDRSSPEYHANVSRIFELGLWSFQDEIDVDGINRALRRTIGAPAALEWVRTLPSGSSPLTELFERLHIEQQQFLAGYLVTAGLTDDDAAETGPAEPDEAEAEKATRVIRTYLRHVGEGIRLTGAGYLPPKAVVAFMEELDPEKRAYGQGNREANVPDLIALREAVNGLGLVRKYKGALSLTKRGAQLADAPVALWRHVVERLPAERTPDGRDIAGLLLLLVAAGEAGDLGELRTSLDLMSAMLGWRFEGRGRYGNAQAILAAEGTRGVLAWAGSGTLFGDRSDRPGLDAPGARLLAREALAPRR